MRVSLIVASEPDAFNHKQQNFFASIAAQTYPHDAFEFILVDGQTKASTSRGICRVSPTLSCDLGFVTQLSNYGTGDSKQHGCRSGRW